MVAFRLLIRRLLLLLLMWLRFRLRLVVRFWVLLQVRVCLLVGLFLRIWVLLLVVMMLSIVRVRVVRLVGGRIRVLVRVLLLLGLSASTLYQVQVRAVNGEGNSGWSPTANFTTGSSSVTNTLPVFTSSPTFSVNENSVAVSTVMAFDSDSQDSVTGYRISSGVDRARFSITNDGELTFNSAPNFESPVDSGGNNVYDLVVTATSGTGGRVQTANQTITVTVTDVVEVPSRPDAPTLSSPSSTSLSVSWSAPSNMGPAISGYDVEYRQGTSGSFSGWSHSGTGTSATITGLSASTSYQVQVRAVNDEGNSSWSPTANFTTRSTPPPPPPETNNPPAFTSSSSFSVNENTVSVGNVVASDSDSQDSVTGYRISSGVDRARFSITDEGVLSFVFCS